MASAADNNEKRLLDMTRQSLVSNLHFPQILMSVLQKNCLDISFL